jgi:hypothetical protein
MRRFNGHRWRCSLPAAAWALGAGLLLAFGAPAAAAIAGAEGAHLVTQSAHAPTAVRSGKPRRARAKGKGRKMKAQQVWRGGDWPAWRYQPSFQWAPGHAGAPVWSSYPYPGANFFTSSATPSSFSGYGQRRGR